MDEEKARKILGDWIVEDGLSCLGPYVAYTKGDDITLDARFNLEELEAIVWWMKNG